MAMENMCAQMIRWLQDKSASSEIIDQYRAAWRHAMQNSGEPIPCPACFTLGNTARLTPLPDSKGTSGAVCVSCRSKFEWPSPE